MRYILIINFTVNRINFWSLYVLLNSGIKSNIGDSFPLNRSKASKIRGGNILSKTSLRSFASNSLSESEMPPPSKKATLIGIETNEL